MRRRAAGQSLRLIARKSRSSRGHFLHSTPFRAVPIQDVEVFPNTNTNTSKTRNHALILQHPRLGRIVAPVGSLVAKGDVVAILHNSDEIKKEKGSSTTTQIRSPCSGKIHAFCCSVDESPFRQQSTDDDDDDIKHSACPAVLFQVDTDVSASSDVSDFLKHIAEQNAHNTNNRNSMKLDPAFFRSYLELDDPSRIWTLAVLLVDRFPSLDIPALQLLERLQVLQEETNDSNIVVTTEERVQTALYTSRLLWRMGDREQALTQAVRAAVHLDPTSAIAQRHLGALARQCQHFDTALQAEEQLMTLLEKKDDDKIQERCSAMHRAAEAHLYLGNSEKSLELGQKALQLASKESAPSNGELMANCHDFLADIYHHQQQQRRGTQDNHAALLEHRQTALQLRHQENPTSDSTVQAHVRFGLELVEGGEILAGLEQLEAARTIRESDNGNNNDADRQMIYAALGSAHYQLAASSGGGSTNNDNPMGEGGDDGVVHHPPENKAVEYFQKALDLVLPKDDQMPSPSPIDAATAWNNLGQAQLQQRDFDHSLRSHSAALDAIRSGKDTNNDSPGKNAATMQQLLEAETHVFLGAVYRQQNQLDLSLSSHQSGHEILCDVFGKDGDNVDVASSHNTLGGLLLALKRTSDALVEYEQACRIFEKTLGKHGHTAVAHFNMGVCLEKLGDLETAIGHFETSRTMWGNNNDQADAASTAIRRCKDQLPK